ncbi:hypothetical protein [Brevundimonas sp.]|uniref:hypothetical protein n=1 Tax=Brevundimonas sp. TaxID=1871086 RepID=UPI002ED9E81C
MKNRIVVVLSGLFILLSAYSAFTGVVVPEGSLGDSYLVLKPMPSFERVFGGGEEGAWTRAHPGEPAPWWQDLDSRPSAYLGDWENGSTPVGVLDMAANLLWLASLLGLIVYGLRAMVRRLGGGRRPVR